MNNSHSDNGASTSPLDSTLKKTNREPLKTRWFFIVCILWSIFQLWTAADFPFYLSQITGLKLVFNAQEV